jgi:hypothetical protein
MAVARGLTRNLHARLQAVMLDVREARPYSPALMINAVTILFEMRRTRMIAVRAVVCV